MRPRRVLGERGLREGAELFEGGLLWSIRRRPAAARCSGTSRRESPAARWTRAPARPRREPNGEVRVVEVGEAVRRARPRPHAALLPRPGRSRARPAGSAAPRSRRRPYDHAVDLRTRGLRRDLEPAGRADQGEARPPGRAVTSREEDLPGSVSEPVREERAAQAASASQVAPETTCGGSPRMGARGRRPGRSAGPLVTAATTRTTSGLPRRSPPGAITTRSEECRNLQDVLAQPPGAIPVSSSASIHDPAAHPGAARRRTAGPTNLRLAAAGPGDGEPGDLVLHRCRHRHGPILPRYEKIRSYAAANNSGSCRGPSGRRPGPAQPYRPIFSPPRRGCRDRVRRPRRREPRRW